jgi:hypothetical protein
MKKALLNSLLLAFFYISSAATIGEAHRLEYYDPSLCSLMTGKNGTVSYNIVKINKKANKIKVEYMSSSGTSGTIKNRYENFKRVHPNIVAYSSGAYMDDLGNGNYVPVGLNIDHGSVVNRDLKAKGYDALVIVYSNGGITVNNLVNNSVTTDAGLFKIRNADGRDKLSFISWAQKNKVTVFQTHLLVENDVLKIQKNGCLQCDPRERRFLVSSKDKSTGDVYNYIIQRDIKSSATLFDAASDALEYFKKRSISIQWMINIDTGMQDTFAFFTSDGKLHPNIAGKTDMSEARNLLVYYYE